MAFKISLGLHIESQKATNHKGEDKLSLKTEKRLSNKETFRYHSRGTWLHFISSAILAFRVQGV